MLMAHHHCWPGCSQGRQTTERSSQHSTEPSLIGQTDRILSQSSFYLVNFSLLVYHEMEHVASLRGGNL